jgi:hypothetical protein
MKLVPFLIAVLALAGCGCHGQDPYASDETHKQADRLQEIQNKSNGDWKQLTPEDKDYLVKTLAHGNETTAKMLLGPPKIKPKGN